VIALDSNLLIHAHREDNPFHVAARETVERLRNLASAARLKGPPIHDARIAALCLHHGVSELWSADRDFSAFPRLKVRNPLVKR